MPTGTAGNGAKSRARTKAKVDEAYAARLVDLQEQAQAQYNSLSWTITRPWQHPSDFTGDLLKIEDLGQPGYDRTALNVNYEECINDPKQAGTTGDVISLKLQIDHMAAQEQAYRYRHAQLPRCLLHSVSRRYGAGTGKVLERIRKEVEDFIASGGAQ